MDLEEVKETEQKIWKIITVCLVLIILLFASTYVFAGEIINKTMVQKNNRVFEENFMFNSFALFDTVRLKEHKREYVKKQERKQIKKASIVFTGDFGMGSPYGRKLNFDDYYKQYGAKYFFEDLKPITNNIDGYFVNLENPFTTSKDYLKKIWVYKAHSNDYIDILTENKVKWANVMNNHIHDYKQKGADDTVKLLEENGIMPVGTNITKAYTSDNEIPSIQMENRQIIEIDGIKIGVVGYVSYYQNMIPDSKVKEDVEYLKKHSDYVVINMHWGNCYTQTVSNLQRSRARDFTKYGPDLIIGNHPHVLQEIEEYNGTKIYYSLGNFIFAHKSSARDVNGVLVELEITKQNDEITPKLTNIPINWVGSNSKNIFQPYIETNPNRIADIERKLKINIDFNLENYLDSKKGEIENG